MHFVLLITGDMSLKVSLSSIGCQNQWFLIARLTVSWRIRVMDTELNTNELQRMIRVAQLTES